MILPESTGSSPAITLSRVDLPMPESPITATYSPAATSSETAFSTVRMPNRLVTAASLSTVESYYARCRATGDPAPSRPGDDPGGIARRHRRGGAAAAARPARGAARDRQPVRPGNRRGGVARRHRPPAHARRPGRALPHRADGRPGIAAAGTEPDDTIHLLSPLAPP